MFEQEQHSQQNFQYLHDSTYPACQTLCNGILAFKENAQTQNVKLQINKHTCIHNIQKKNK